MERSSPAALASADRWLIEDIVVDVGQRKLWRLDEPLPVTRLTFDLLLTLMVIKHNLREIAALDEPRFVRLRERIESVD